MFEMDYDSDDENFILKYESELDDLKSSFYDAIYYMKKSNDYESMSIDSSKNQLLDSILTWYKQNYPMQTAKTKPKPKKEKEEKIVPVFSNNDLKIGYKSYASRLKK